MRSLAIGLMLAALTACSRETKPPEAPPTAPVAAPAKPSASTPAADPRPVIVTFGDSLTAGGEGSYPFFLQQELDRRGYRYRVINEGVAGDTTTDGLARIETVLADKPELVVLELGGNDGLRGIPVPVTQANLERIVEQLLAAHIRVVLAGITLPPNYGKEYIRPFEAMYRQLATSFHLTFIPFLLKDVALVEGMMGADGIHPTAKGNRVVAANVLRALEPLLRR